MPVSTCPPGQRQRRNQEHCLQYSTTLEQAEAIGRDRLLEVEQSVGTADPVAIGVIRLKVVVVAKQASGVRVQYRLRCLVIADIKKPSSGSRCDTFRSSCTFQFSHAIPLTNVRIDNLEARKSLYLGAAGTTT